MRGVLFVGLVLIGNLVAVGACSSSEETSAPSQTSVEVAIDELMNQKHINKQAEVAVGGTLRVALGSNPTTGFKWSEEGEIGDENLLQQIHHAFVGPEEKGGTPLPPGTAGKEEWSFKALKAGTTTVTMEYSRPWEGGEKREWTFNLAVSLK